MAWLCTGVLAPACAQLISRSRTLAQLGNTRLPEHRQVPLPGTPQCASCLNFNTCCCLGSFPLPFPWISRCWNDSYGHLEHMSHVLSTPLDKQVDCRWLAGGEVSVLWPLTIPSSRAQPPAAHLPRDFPCGWRHHRVPIQPYKNSMSRELFASFTSRPMLSLNQAEEHLCNPPVSSCILQSHSDCWNWQD